MIKLKYTLCNNSFSELSLKITHNKNNNNNNKN